MNSLPKDTPVRWIYVSPHFDDAVYSCGGVIHEQTCRGLDIEVWTVCAGDPPPGALSALAARVHAEWGTGSAAETVALRRIEDQAALGLVGARGRALDVPDCIYRRSPAGEVFYPDRLNGDCNPLEASLELEITAAISHRLRAGDVLVCPLAIGGHVDHVLTRAALERLGRALIYYAEVPYLFNFPEDMVAATRGMRADLQPVPEESLEAWLAGIAAYASQTGVQFKDEARMRTVMREYWERRRGIELWSPA
jgi:LmbE family N-acetylglucosaminyl deacetylase